LRIRNKNGSKREQRIFKDYKNKKNNKELDKNNKEKRLSNKNI
jgi:hypothetical protein